MKHFSTDLDRDEKSWSDYPKDDPAERKALWIIMIACLVIPMVGMSLVLIYADRIDAFMNTRVGAFTIIGIFGVIGISWFVWRIRKLL